MNNEIIKMHLVIIGLVFSVPPMFWLIEKFGADNIILPVYMIILIFYEVLLFRELNRLKREKQFNKGINKGEK